MNKVSIEDNAQRLGIPIYTGEEIKALLSAADFIHVSFKAIQEREKACSVR
jgi:hypothetical protein